MEGRFGRDVFLALAAVGWADGHFDPEEADAIVAAALEEGLELDEIAAIEAATKDPIELSSIDISGMSKADRLFVYAVASWMTRLDGVEDASEESALDKLGAALKIPAAPRLRADEIAREVAELEGEHEVFRYDLKALRVTIAARLAEAQRMRAEANEEEPEASA